MQRRGRVNLADGLSVKTASKEGSSPAVQNSVLVGHLWAALVRVLHAELLEAWTPELASMSLNHTAPSPQESLNPSLSVLIYKVEMMPTCGMESVVKVTGDNTHSH